MRKIIALIISLSIISMVGCRNKTIVIEEYDKIQQSSSKSKVIERNIYNKQEDMIFSPVEYKDDKVYGTLTSTKSDRDFYPDKIKQPYCIDINGEFNNLEKSYFSYEKKKYIDPLGGGLLYGVYEEESYKNTDFYYIDSNNDIKIKLQGYEAFYDELEKPNVYSISNGFKINENYYLQNRYAAQVIEEKINVINQVLTIVDIKNKTSYTTEVLEPSYGYLYYDKKENSIMAIDLSGGVSKVILSENEVKFEKYKNIEMKGLTFNLNTTFINSFTMGENLLLGLSRGTEELQYAIYNIYSNEVIIVDNFIKANIENNDLFIDSFKGDLYLSKIVDNKRIEPLHKISNGKEFDYVRAIMNDEGNSIFLLKLNYPTEVSNKDISEVEYSFIELEE